MKCQFCFLVILCGTLGVLSKPFENGLRQKRAVCGYEACRKVDSSTLNVHMVPHSHDDVGWLKTISQYYYGSRNDIQHAGVQYIISSVVEALKLNPERRFIQVETAFFAKWWSRQTEEEKEIYRELINNGQIEIIGGGWSMNDEAASHYQSTIDQFTLGLGFIEETLGECGRPKIGWQIDPFGHSREMASLFAQFGYDAFFFGRLEYRDKNARLDSKTPDLIWRGSANLGNKSDIFTTVLYNDYGAPWGFCFDVLCNDDPIIDDETSPDYNYDNKVTDFANFIRGQADKYQTSNIIITMGGDFNYQDALTYYLNIDRLLKGFELFEQTYNGKPINIFYSTPSCYAKAVNDQGKEEDLEFPLKTDDFFPYANDPDSYWTGYFTSRTTSKRFERQSNNILQVTKQLSTLARSSTYLTNTEPLREAMGMMQHHDAITGTEKQHVADDYHRILTDAVEKATVQSNASISDLLKRNRNADVSLNLQSCLLANISFCEASAKEKFIVTVYNPLSRSVSQYVQLPVPSTDFIIIAPTGEEVAYQVTVSPKDFSYTGFDTVPYVLVFRVENIPPLGLKVYYITNNDPDGSAANVEADTSNSRFTLGDDTLGAEVDSDTGRLKSLSVSGQLLAVDQDFLYYLSSKDGRSSGAYVFRPSKDDPTAQHFNQTVVSTRTYKGSLFDEIHQVFDESVQQVIRVYRDVPYVEFDWIVGPINRDDYGKEIISRFTTNIKSDDTFYTDSNGREMLKRVRNYRPTYEYTDEEPISGNYYPITSKIVIKDEDSNFEFAVLNDRAQGGSSLESGQVELMLHRRCTNDDGYGVGEALNEEQYGMGLIARGQHFVTFGPITGSEKSTAAIERDIAQRKILAPWVFVSQYEGERQDLLQDFNLQFPGLTASLPDNVQILTLEPWKDDDTVLLRLEHVLEGDEDETLSQSVTVNLEGIFSLFRVVSLRETTLAANQWLEENERLEWRVGDFLGNSNEAASKTFVTPVADDGPLDVTLAPMQIRTFIATVQYIM